MAVGQSGHFRSSWYEDQLEAQAQGKMYPQLFLPKDYRKYESLSLLPNDG